MATPDRTNRAGLTPDATQKPGLDTTASTPILRDGRASGAERDRFKVRGDVVGYVAHFRHRVLTDALLSATREYWLRRADAFENAMHRPGDFPGLCSVDEIEMRNAQLAEKAEACRARARLAEVDEIEGER